jgi:hypothetical protein
MSLKSRLQALERQLSTSEDAIGRLATVFLAALPDDDLRRLVEIARSVVGGRELSTAQTAFCEQPHIRAIWDEAERAAARYPAAADSELRQLGEGIASHEH